MKNEGRCLLWRRCYGGLLKEKIWKLFGRAGCVNERCIEIRNNNQ